MRQHPSTVDPRSLANFTSRKVTAIATGPLAETPDSLAAWVERYPALAAAGVRSAGIGDKIAFHLARFVAFFTTAYGHDLRACYPRRNLSIGMRHRLGDNSEHPPVLPFSSAG